MNCPSCRKRVVFGSVSGPAWTKIHMGEWLYGGRPPALGKLGDCPVCGARLEWEPGERLLHDPNAAVLARVHLSALRESPEAWSGKKISMRALLVEEGGAGFLSDSWRARPKGDAEPEDDAALVARLAKEQLPRVEVSWGSQEVHARFGESARILEGSARAAWIELDGRFEVEGESRTLTIDAIASIWPPKE